MSKKGYRQKENLAYVCRKHNEWKIPRKFSEENSIYFHTNLAPIYQNNSGYIIDLSSNGKWVALLNSTGYIMGTAHLKIHKYRMFLNVTNIYGCHVNKTKKAFIAPSSKYSIYANILRITNSTLTGNNYVMLQFEEEGTHPEHWLTGGTSEKICWWTGNESRSLDPPIPKDIILTQGNITLILHCKTGNCSVCPLQSNLIRNIKQSPTYKCTKYNHKGVTKVEYVHPHINIKEALKHRKG